MFQIFESVLRGQIPMRHQTLLRFLSSFLPGTSIAASGNNMLADQRAQGNFIMGHREHEGKSIFLV